MALPLLGVDDAVAGCAGSCGAILYCGYGGRSMRGRLAFVAFSLLLGGCATPPKPQPTVAWIPAAQWWNTASVSGGRLIEKDGTAHPLTSTQARNVAEARAKLSAQSGIDPRLAIVKSGEV